MERPVEQTLQNPDEQLGDTSATLGAKSSVFSKRCASLHTFGGSDDRCTTPWLWSIPTIINSVEPEPGVRGDGRPEGLHEPATVCLESELTPQKIQDLEDVGTKDAGCAYHVSVPDNRLE